MKNQTTYISFDELVFDDRNKEYGAYFLRRIYIRHLFISLVIALLLLIAAVAGPGLVKKLKKEEEKVKVEKTTVVALEAPPPLDEDKAELEPLEVPPAPLQEMIKFTVPEVTEEPIAEQEEVATQEELKESYAGEKTQEGVDFGEIKVDTTSLKTVEEVKEPEPFTFVEQMPSFPGGQPQLMKYLRDNIKYPDEAIENNIQGKVMVEFVVGAGGVIKNIRVLRGIGGGCDEEAVRVIQNMPKWNPGKQNGVAVPVKVVVPISFTLNSN